MPLHLPVEACAQLQYVCSHTHIWLCLPLRAQSDQLKLAHTPLLFTRLQLQGKANSWWDNVSVCVCVIKLFLS